MHSVKQVGDVTTVRLTGDLDIVVRANIARLFQSLSGPIVALDLTAIPYMDAGSVSEILELHRRLAASGGHVRLAVLRGSLCARLVEIVGLQRIMPVELLDDPSRAA